MEPRQPYPTDLTDQEWTVLEPSIPQAKSRGRRATYPTREILHGLLSVLRSGGAWRRLPHDLPPWESVDQDCWRWRHDGTWQLSHDRLRGEVRVAAGRQRQPSAGIIDSQSVKTTAKGGATGMINPNMSTGASAISSSIREASGWGWW
jgi:putative transposase